LFLELSLRNSVQFKEQQKHISKTPYKTSETPKTDNIFIYLRFDYIQESLAIQRYKPELNHGLKASKELIIFN
jgi:hypothetical protein